MQSGKTGIDNRFCSKCSANKMGRATDSIQTAAVNEMEGHKEPLVVLEGLDSPCWAYMGMRCTLFISFAYIISCIACQARRCRTCKRQQSCRPALHRIIHHIHFLIKMHVALQSETTMIPSVVCRPEYTEQSRWKLQQFTVASNNIHGITAMPNVQ